MGLPILDGRVDAAEGMMRRFVDTWVWPVLWLLLVPLITVPLTLRLLGELEGCTALLQTPPPGYRCSAPAALLSLAPGLLNLLPALWLRSHDRRVRSAALLATALGVIRLVVPAVMYLAQGANVWIVYGITWLPNPNSTLVSLGLWIVSLCVAAGFVGFAIGRGPSMPAAGSAPDLLVPPAPTRDEPGAAPAR
jgi:hypothetical protein